MLSALWAFGPQWQPGSLALWALEPERLRRGPNFDDAPAAVSGSLKKRVFIYKYLVVNRVSAFCPSGAAYGLRRSRDPTKKKGSRAAASDLASGSSLVQRSCTCV